MRGDLDKPRYALDLSLLHIPDHELFAHAEVRAVSQEKELLSAPHPFCCLDLYRVSRTSIERLRCPFKVRLFNTLVLSLGAPRGFYLPVLFPYTTRSLRRPCVLLCDASFDQEREESALYLHPSRVRGCLAVGLLRVPPA